MASSIHRIAGTSTVRRRSFMAQPLRSKTGVYQLRRKVPPDLKATLGHEYKRSLRTRDPSEAKARFAEEWARSEQAFSLARAQAQGVSILGERDMQQLASRWFRSEQQRMETSGRFEEWLVEGALWGAGTDEAWQETTQMCSLRQALEEDPEWDVSEKVNGLVRKALAVNALPMPSDSALVARLSAVFMDYCLKLSDLAWERYSGNWTAQASVLPSEPLTVERRKAEGRSPTLVALFDSYASEKKLNDGDTRAVRKTIGAYRAVVEQFVELFGDIAVSDISREMIRDYRAALAQLPVSGKGIRRLTARQLIAKANTEDLPRLTAPTIRNKLRALSTVMSHAVRMGHLAENPVIASGVAKAAAKTASREGGVRNRRRDYSKEELRLIFSSPIYSKTGWASPRADFGEAWYWMPLLMYYTGARREELAQLRVADVKTSSGRLLIPHLSILETLDEDDDRSVKTASSRRPIPLHPDLIDRGLLDYAASQPGGGQLFPLLTPNPAGFYGANFGKRWASYLRDVVGLRSPVSPSHGFRHTFKTLCREVGMPEDVHDAITGHAGTGSVARDYGQMPLQRMAEEMTKLVSIDSLLESEGQDIQPL